MQFFKDNINFDFMGKRRAFGMLSAIVVGLSMVLTFVIGPKFGIDFMGGTEIQVRFAQKVDPGAVRETLKDLGFPTAEVASYAMASIHPVAK